MHLAWAIRVVALLGQGEGCAALAVGEVGEDAVFVAQPVDDLFGGEAREQQVGAEVRFRGSELL